jgi:hypothetical protein
MARNIFQEISRKEAQSILKENWKNTIKNGSKIHDLPFATFLDKSQLFLDKAQLFMKSFDIDFYQFGNLGWVFVHWTGSPLDCMAIRIFSPSWDTYHTFLWNSMLVAYVLKYLFKIAMDFKGIYPVVLEYSRDPENHPPNTCTVRNWGGTWLSNGLQH